MALTRVAAAGINTGGTFVLENVNTSGIVTAGTVQVGAATTIHSGGIDLGSGNITSHNINSTGIITATGGFVGAVTGNVTGNLTGNITGNVTGNLTGDVTGDLTGNVTGNVTGNLTGNVTGNVSSSGANTLGSLSVTNDATVGGALTITGNLTVNGTTTTIDTAVTAVDSLAIDGDASVGGALTATGNITANAFYGDGSNLTGIDATQIQTGNTNVQTVDTGSDGHVKVTTEGTERLRVTSGGNVGIATTNPTSKLQVVGDTHISGVATAFDFYNSAEYPNVRPTLDLAFAQTKILDSRITFTRSSTATYYDANGVIKTAAVDEARFDHDPDTGESLGLLLEESRTNIALYSQEFNNVYWSKTGGGNPGTSVTANQAVAPDGTTTADYIDYTTAIANSQNIERSYDATPAGKTYTASVWIKGTSGQTINLTLDGYGANGSAEQFTLNGNWQRFSITRTYPAGSPAAMFRFGTRNLNHPSAGTATQIYAWGAQIEEASFSTSYIPTTSSTVTRSADDASITGTNFSSWFNTSSSTIFTEYKTNRSGWYVPLWSLNDNGNSNALWLQGYHNNQWNPYLTGLGNGSFSTTGGGPFSGHNKVAVSLETGSFQMVENGTINTSVASSNITGPFTAVTRLRFAVSNATSNTLGSITFARLTHYPVRLSDTILQTITL